LLSLLVAGWYFFDEKQESLGWPLVALSLQGGQNFLSGKILNKKVFCIN